MGKKALLRCEGYMLVTRDIQVSKRFYTDLIGTSIVLELPKHIVFKEGFSLLQEDDWRSFAELGTLPCVYPHRTGQLVFEVDELAPFLHRLDLFPNVTLLHPAKEHPWGRWAVRLYDPDDHVVEVGESMRTVVMRFLKNGLSVEEAAARSEFPLAFVRRCQAQLAKKN